MGRSNPKRIIRCKKHPKHNQSIGVCPFCLRERLSHLSKLSSTTTSSSSSFLTYTMYSSSSSSSSAASLYSDDDSELSDSHSPFYHEGKRSRWSLTKSRSMAFAIGRRKKEEGKEKEKEPKKGKEEAKEKEKEKEKEKKKRFWFKLSGYISGRRRDQEGCSLTHSKTLKEKPSAKWVLFA